MLIPRITKAPLLHKPTSCNSSDLLAINNHPVVGQQCKIRNSTKEEEPVKEELVEKQSEEPVLSAQFSSRFGDLLNSSSGAAVNSICEGLVGIGENSYELGNEVSNLANNLANDLAKTSTVISMKDLIFEPDPESRIPQTKSKKAEKLVYNHEIKANEKENDQPTDSFIEDNGGERDDENCTIM